jgi:putative transposase
MEKFQNKYRIPSTRLKGYDYGSNGIYYVTICTKNREYYFGNIVETGNYPSLQATFIGQVANDYWTEIPKHYPFVNLDEFVIMPNHIHGILVFNKPDYNESKPNQFGIQSKKLGAVIRGFKSTTKRFANENNIEFEWQTRYHDRIIRNEKELNAIRQYIINNPQNWQKDALSVETDNYPSQNNLHTPVETQDFLSLTRSIEQETETLFKEIEKLDQNSSES